MCFYEMSIWNHQQKYPYIGRRYTYCRVVARSENPGGGLVRPCSTVVGIICPLVEIGLTIRLKTGSPLRLQWKHLFPKSLLFNVASIKICKFQNEFMKTSFLPKYQPNIVRISAQYCATLLGRNPYNFWFIFWENRWLHKCILKFTDLHNRNQSSYRI